MYLRFILPTKSPDSGVEDGVFDAAYKIREEGGLSEPERQELSELLRWFGKNLKVPTRFNRTKSKGCYRRATKGVSWFKPSAGLHLAKLHRMVTILRSHGHHVSMIKSANPGYLVYEDDHQIVAEPFNDQRKLRD